jgi:hypothetical protein
VALYAELESYSFRRPRDEDAQSDRPTAGTEIIVFVEDRDRDDPIRTISTLLGVVLYAQQSSSYCRFRPLELYSAGNLYRNQAEDRSIGVYHDENRTA